MYAESTVIYADILFVINFSLDFLCLFITDKVLNGGGKLRRLIFGAAIGGCYSFLPYIFELPVFVSVPLHIIAAVLICFVAFGKRDLRRFFLLSGTFIVSSALLGGLITAIYGLSGDYSNGAYTEVDAVSFCLICLVSAAIALSYGMICKKKILTRSAEVKIYANGRKFDARLLIDSGNLVTEPFSALPVIVVSSYALPPPFDAPERESFPLPIRAIPFSTSAGKSCFFGFRPDKIEIIRPAKKPLRVDAFIGIDTENRNYSGYDGLIPTSLL